MAAYCRLRQICLVAADLPRAIADMQAIFGVKLAYQDPHVRRYGLQNALFPFGLAFVEIVSPVEPDTAAGRFLERSGGSGGYMAIFNCSDPQRRGLNANALGVRTAHTIDHPGFHAVQLHPRDCRAAMIEFDRTDGEEDLRGPYGPAGGTGWTRRDPNRCHQAAGRDRPRKPRSRRPWAALGAHPGDAVRCRWRRRPHHADMTAIQFTRGDGAREILRTLVIEVADRSGIEARAKERGYPVSDAGVEFCGVRFKLMIHTA